MDAALQGHTLQSGLFLRASEDVWALTQPEEGNLTIRFKTHLQLSFHVLPGNVFSEILFHYLEIPFQSLFSLFTIQTGHVM